MWETIQTNWAEYYPVIVAGMGALIVFLGVAYGVYTQVSVITKPILDKIQAFRDKDDESTLANASLENIKIDVLKTDLLAKIENPSISPALTLLYQTQLDKLEAMTLATSGVIAKVEDTTDNYL